MAYNIGFILLVCVAFAWAGYNPYSPYPPANARGPATSTYNRAQDFRAAGRSPGYGSVFSSSKTSKLNGNGGVEAFNGASYGQQFNGQYNGYNGDSQLSSSAYGPSSAGLSTYQSSNGVSSYAQGAYGAASLTNGYSGSAYNGGYDDLAQPSADDPDGDSIVGVAGTDYPAYTEVPQTSFSCANHQFPGLYADPEAQCQVFHICQQDGRQDSFLCPVGSIFNQEYFVCEWWYNVDCSLAQNLYTLNADLYQDSSRYSAATSYAASLSSDSYGPFGSFGANGAYAPSSVYGNGGNGGKYASGRASASPLASSY